MVRNVKDDSWKQVANTDTILHQNLLAVALVAGRLLRSPEVRMEVVCKQQQTTHQVVVKHCNV